jgi:phage repressor protein C with HTH and peptisase S24 domain
MVRTKKSSELVESQPDYVAALPATDLPGLGRRLGDMIAMYGTQIDAAKAIGRAPETLQNWVKGRMPAFGDVARMALEKGVRLDWLATGKGAMLAGERDPALNSEYVFITRYDVRAAAGSGQPVLSEDVTGLLAFRQDWIRGRLRRNPDKLAIFEAYGDSMMPTIADGDIMLVDTSEIEVRGPAIYVVLAGNQAIVKRVELKMDGSLVVKSDNPAYEPYIYKPDKAPELRVLGKVVWAGGML